jgi:hypothetical protein
MRVRRSAVKDFFTPLQNSVRHEFSCNECGKIIFSSGNTTNRITHLKNYHPELHEEYEANSVILLGRNCGMSINILVYFELKLNALSFS